MLFSVGYGVRANGAFVDEIIRQKNKIYEVYFSFADMPSGRNSQIRAEGLLPHEAMEKEIFDLKRMSEAGLRFNLLFNANCYGEKTLSKSFFSSVGDTVGFVKDSFGLSSVTTTSPLIAKFIKQNFPEIETRASVNMGIGSIESLEYFGSLFDSFYVKREMNRNISSLKALRDEALNIGKRMFILANSGCLNNCAAHTFHDNLVAHEAAAMTYDNGYEFRGVCREYLSDPLHIGAILTRTNFIRPEDVYLYEEICHAMKLATRVSKNPVSIMTSYIERGKYSGNIASLLEPDHSGVMYPYVADNRKIDVKLKDGNLIYSDSGKTFIKLEDNYAYQQNDQGCGV